MSEKKIKKYIAYSRVSTQRQRYDKTIENQNEKLRNYEENHEGIKIVEWFEDDGISGLKDEMGRPEYRKLKRLLQKDDINGVISTQLDRLGRSNLELQKFFNDVIQKEKKDLILLSHNLDTSTKEGKFAFDVLCAQVEYDVRNIKERLKYGWKKEYKEHPEKFGRPTKEIPDILKKKMIYWYTRQILGFQRISNLIYSENINEYPDWFKREYIGFGKTTEKEKEEGLKRFYLSPVIVGKRLKKWEIKIRKPKLLGEKLKNIKKIKENE